MLTPALLRLLDTEAPPHGAYLMQRSLAQFGAFFAGLLAAVAGVQLVLGGMAVVLVALAVAVFAPHERLRTLA